MDSYGSFPIKKLKKIIKKCEDVGAEDLTFEFLIASLFPEIMDNIKTAMTKQYIEGYNAGVESSKKEKLNPQKKEKRKKQNKI